MFVVKSAVTLKTNFSDDGGEEVNHQIQ